MKGPSPTVTLFVSHWQASQSRLFTPKPIPAPVLARRPPEVFIPLSTRMSRPFSTRRNFVSRKSIPSPAAIAGEAGVGLGPTFNGNSCAQCHAQPTIGGASPGPPARRTPSRIRRLHSPRSTARPTRFPHSSPRMARCSKPASSRLPTARSTAESTTSTPSPAVPTPRAAPWRSPTLPPLFPPTM